MLNENYIPVTTFWMDFSIADRFGLCAVKDTYKRGLEYAETDYKAFTELVLVLNHKSWQHQECEELCDLYIDLFYKAKDRFYEVFTDKEARDYFFDVTD